MVKENNCTTMENILTYNEDFIMIREIRELQFSSGTQGIKELSRQAMWKLLIATRTYTKEFKRLTLM